jgi:hypothetical protein
LEEQTVLLPLLKPKANFKSNRKSSLMRVLGTKAISRLKVSNHVVVPKVVCANSMRPPRVQLFVV